MKKFLPIILIIIVIIIGVGIFYWFIFGSLSKSRDVDYTPTLEECDQNPSSYECLGVYSSEEGSN